MNNDVKDVIEIIKDFMFKENGEEKKNEDGYSHELMFETWADEASFIVKDSITGKEFRIRVSNEKE